MSNQQAQDFDNVKIARRQLEQATRLADDGHPNAATRRTLAANVSASLAIAEQLERLNDTLDSVVGLSESHFGTENHHIRTGR